MEDGEKEKEKKKKKKKNALRALFHHNAHDAHGKMLNVVARLRETFARASGPRSESDEVAEVRGRERKSGENARE